MLEVGDGMFPMVALFPSDSRDGSESESEPESPLMSEISNSWPSSPSGMSTHEGGKDDGPEDKFDKGLSKGGTVKYEERPI